MADIIFNTQTVTGFVFDDTFQAYTPGNISPPQFVLEDGVEYTVIWETDTFKCTAFSFTFSGMTIIAIGNGATFGYSGNDEPFCMTYNTYADVSQIFAAQEGDSHTVGIYKAAAPAASAIVLKDRDGNDVPYEGVKRIRVFTTDGGTQRFLAGEPGTLEVALNFGEGDMTLVPDEGTLWTQVDIPKPVNLIPENIAKDAEIAGVVGIFEGGGAVSIDTEALKYFVYQVDSENSEIILYGILYSELYADTGSYDVYIPDKIGTFDVVIAAGGVG